MSTSHRTEAALTAAAAALCAYLATGSVQAHAWFSVTVFAVLALLLARISYREQQAARAERDTAVRAELHARPATECGPACAEQHTYASRCAMATPRRLPARLRQETDRA